MRLSRVLGFLALTFLATPSLATGQGTGIIRGRVVDASSSAPLTGVQITVDGTRLGTQTNSDGSFSVAGVPSGPQFVRLRRVGYMPERVGITVGAGATVTQNFTLRQMPTTLNEVVVTALGETISQRSLGTAQQAVKGAAIAETQRESFINALQGRVAGVQVVSSSGVPGASSSITIRGISSISGSNQPLMIIDGLPMDNKTLNTASVLASEAPGSALGFANRGVDFTNRAADLNPEDIESLVVLKGPEASALYGIDAANGAIVITTKRGKAGRGGLEYSNSFRIESPRSAPEVQRVYQPSAVGSSTFLYYGDPYPAGTEFFDNIDGFFQTSVTQKHNLAFSGASADSKINYRVASSLTNQEGVVPNSKYNRVNVTGASQAQVTKWLNADLSMGYTYADNRQPLKGEGGPLLGLLVWPATDDAKDYLSPAGQRRRLTNLAASSEVDNPYFNVNKNQVNSKNNRIIANLGLKFTPFSWGNIKTNIGTDSYANQNLILRHPESTFGVNQNGLIDVADDITRNISAQTLLNVNPIQLGAFSVNGLLGHSISDFKSQTDASFGRDFLEPNFVSVNNAAIKSSRSTINQRRLVSAFGSLTLSFKEFLYLTATGRNDWTSTIPVERNSFFYPSISGSFVFSDAIPAIGRRMTGKIRAAYAEVGKDARPYAYRPSLQFKPTVAGGYGYDFWGPNLGLKPEFARSYEIGIEMSFLQDRLGLDMTFYRKQTKDQIVNDVRGSYATGYILFNLNGAETRNQGFELTLRTTPILTNSFSWDVLANFDKAHGKTLALPFALPESYVSDTWLFGNVRNGTAPGLSTQSLTGLFYLRNNQGKLLIDPTSGLPLRSATFIDAGYDRTPDFLLGITNTFKRKGLSLSMLWDIRKGGDVFNATEQWLTARGLAMRTLDRWEPRVVDGVLRDGKENTATPTINNIVVVPGVQTSYYTAISEELFIEKDINWLRLRDLTIQYTLPERLIRNASIFVTGTDLLLWTNYSGLDPIVNGNTAAVGGSGAAGIDYGNFPMPQGYNIGIKVSR
ncbi:MAG TPA: SusC/RagA family TonB-linked outer membrane protein [Gemmatimonadaceae bacterium]